MAVAFDIKLLLFGEEHWVKKGLLSEGGLRSTSGGSSERRLLQLVRGTSGRPALLPTEESLSSKSIWNRAVCCSRAEGVQSAPYLHSAPSATSEPRAPRPSISRNTWEQKNPRDGQSGSGELAARSFSHSASRGDVCSAATAAALTSSSYRGPCSSVKV